MSKQELTKDPLINFKNPSEKENKWGKMSYKLYLESEDAQNLAALIAEKAAAGTGVRLDLHFNEGTNKTTGNTFLKAFGFVKEKGTNPFQAKSNAPKKASPVESKEDTKKKIDDLRANLAKKQIG